MRRRRRWSQLHLALEAGVSQRHLSFVESGRALPSRDMVLMLSETLSVPLRERNRLLLAAGYAPHFGERTLDDPALKPAMEVVQQVLKGHEPNPAIAVDRHWNMVAANGAIAPFLEGVEEQSLLAPPVNVLRLSLHPKGLAPRIVNLGEWHQHVMERLRRLNDAVADPALAALEQELSGYPSSAAGRRAHAHADAVAVPLRIRAGGRVLSFITTITVFGHPLDVTLSELAIETFFPTDAETAGYLKETANKEEGSREARE
jgi:transcriptional regulator with XRE-family HTH domain